MDRGVKVSRGADETRLLAASFARELRGGEVLSFYGDIGAGKTTFIQGLVSVLAPGHRVQSPTFSYLNIYDTVYHFDLYRLISPEEFVHMGFQDCFQKENIVCIEWSEKIAPYLPKEHLSITINTISEHEREISIVRSSHKRGHLGPFNDVCSHRKIRSNNTINTCSERGEVKNVHTALGERSP